MTLTLEEIKALAQLVDAFNTPSSPVLREFMETRNVDKIMSPPTNPINILENALQEFTQK